MYWVESLIHIKKLLIFDLRQKNNVNFIEEN